MELKGEKKERKKMNQPIKEKKNCTAVQHYLLEESINIKIKLKV